jgi:putative hydrolase of the HAD superfamily
MIRALICDLDNTLFSPSTIPADVVQPVIDAVLEANVGSGAVDPFVLTRALDEGWHRPFDLVARDHDLPDWVLSVWLRENARLEVTMPLELFPDTECLWTTPLPRFLVTTGFRRFQESKVRALGLGPRFDAVIIDAVDEPVRKGKERIFREILTDHPFPAEAFLVLGDSADSEIAAGNRLGMVTVQVQRDGVEPAEHANYHIRTCLELPDILRSLEE